MLICNGLIFLVGIITGFARFNLYALGIEIAIFSFLFSMFTVYGNRAASVGTASLLIMIFMMDKENNTAGEIFIYSFTLLAGGIWYMLQSLLFFRIRPYRAAQQALGENMLDVVKFLRIKAEFYKTGTDFDDNYRKLVSQQIQVSQHQDVVREILFKSRITVKESTYASRILVITFVDLVDLYEQIMATHYDYTDIREKFGYTGVLEDISVILQGMADELDNIGFAILSNTRYNHLKNFDKKLEALKAKIDAVGVNEPGTSNLVLKKVLINLRDLNRRIADIFGYFQTKDSEALLERAAKVEYTKFVSHQDYSTEIFVDNLSLNSAAFKHSVRVALVCIFGFFITKSAEVMMLADYITGRKLVFGYHSYWVLLTIIVILKPGYSLSKQRNYQRLTGTIVGGLIGVAILIYINNTIIQFIFLIIFMVGAYSFQRLNYVVSVIMMTPYVLILFKFLGVGQLNIAQERIVDTIIGSIIAFIASNIIFPTWESDQLTPALRDVLHANTQYLNRIAAVMNGSASSTDYKLARKEVYVTSANLSAAFERMTSEPKSKQRKSKEVHKFVVLNHILSSYLATVASAAFSPNIQGKPHPDFLKLIRRSVAVLNDTGKKLNAKTVEVAIAEKTPSPPQATELPIIELNADEKLLKEQLGFINKVATDIAKVTDNYLA
ncbi:FUSC family protein [Mucilaginibacter myungsuensis]|nr:FUSC family membrane protein [Mucilaginibacter myungsuensis]MDN3597052.1 FUSC family membrane protein [Mucilaginibacter myungsuensis]